MGQSQSLTDTLPNLDEVHMQMIRHTKVFAEINSLTYEEFKNSLQNLNALSRKCIDPDGRQLIFLVKNGSDTTLLWKATVRIACVKVDPQTRRVESYKFLNLKQFLCVFRTFQTHLDTLMSSEIYRNQRRQSLTLDEDAALQGSCGAIYPPELLLKALGNSTDSGNSVSSSTTSPCSPNDNVDECCICLERTTEVILPCAHSFCAPCIEQWNVGKKSCPICSEDLDNMDETWVMSNIPGVEEINDKICSELMNLAQQP